MPLESARGILLIELLVAVAISVTVILSLALLAPKLAKSNLKNRSQLLAAQLLTAKLEELRTQPYALIRPTYDPPGAGLGPWFTLPMGALLTDPDTCDCGSATYSLLPASDTVTMNGLSFSRYWCVSLLGYDGMTPHAYCSVSPDDNKVIWVWVSWKIGLDRATIFRSIGLSRS